MKTDTPVQTIISGYSGLPCTLQCMYNTDTGILLVHAIAPYSPQRIAGCLLVTNNSRISYDALFTSEHLGKAIDAFDAMGGRITYSDDAKRADPSGKIQVTGYDETGPKRAIDDGMSNEKVALLATCWAVSMQDATIDALDMMDELVRLQRGLVTTI